jgi:hypothetical protein
MGVMSLPIFCGCGRIAVFGEPRSQHDAIDGTRGDAQLAAGAPILKHYVQLALRANDGIYRAGGQAARAANTALWIDPHHLRSRFNAAARVEGQRRRAQQRGELLDGLAAARWAAIDVGFASRQCFGVREAALVSAAGALRLRQQRVNGFDAGCVPHWAMLN